MKIIEVLLPLPGVPVLSYSTSEQLQPGNIVVVPFRSKQVAAIVWNIAPEKHYEGALKAVIAKLPYSIAQTYLQFMLRVKNYYLSDLASVAKMVLPVEIESKYPALTHQASLSSNLVQLNQEQATALEKINQAKLPVLLYGVTGSGKTEVYFHLIAQSLAQGRQSLLILPEIALSSQMLERFDKQFGFQCAAWHSNITLKAKKQTIKGIMEGSVKVVMGARSSLFLPYQDLALIIVDEEHDNSYKQESGIYYNARDMAVLRANLFGNKIVLGSATPSIETWQNCQIGKYALAEIDNRYLQAAMPKIEIIDMKQQRLEKNYWISLPIQNKISQYLSKQQQVLLFLNRTGYAPIMLCSSCGLKISCIHCSTNLVWHKNNSRLQCHHCGFFTKMFSNCPACRTGQAFIPCGPGIERLYEETCQLFPQYRHLMVSAEEMTSPKLAKQIIDKINNYEVDIIIGTQIITKGYHFNKLNFVGIIDGDMGFSNCNLRSFESTFQLLQQVSGRAGRTTHGDVMLQTYQKENKIMDLIAQSNYRDFINYELEQRKNSHMPPFTKIATIMLSSANAKYALTSANNILSNAPKMKGIRILGPASPVISKLKGRYRYNLLIIANKELNLQKYIASIIATTKLTSNVTLKIDIDPYNII